MPRPDSRRTRAQRVDATWRIDDLAHRADVTVDTIRYYAREGLLPRPRREGRSKLYGPRHLDRLRRIRDLQDRRFSLAAIKAILETEMPGIEEIFRAGDHQYSLDELAACSGLDDEFVGELRTIGLLPDPAEFGRDAYDTTDLQLLEAGAELLDLGMPEDFLVEIARIYVHHLSEIQRDVLALLRGEGTLRLEPAQLEEVQRRISAESGRVVRATERVMHYLHQRTIQRMALRSMLDAVRDGRSSARAADPGPET
jgi:DNA-binding transcriptional MerR regulator